MRETFLMNSSPCSICGKNLSAKPLHKLQTHHKRTNHLTRRLQPRQALATAPTRTSRDEIRIETAEQQAFKVSQELADKPSQSTAVWSVVNGTASFASQILSHFSRWPSLTSYFGFSDNEAKQVMEEASKKEKEKQLANPPACIDNFLRPVNTAEIKYIRKLSSLCAFTYKLYKVTPEKLRRLSNLELVTTSWSCEFVACGYSAEHEEVTQHGDGMALSIEDIANMYRADQEQQTPTFMSNIVPLPASLSFQRMPKLSPAEIVANKLAEAASAASASATSSSVAQAASTLYSGFLSTALGSSSASSTQVQSTLLSATSILSANAMPTDLPSQTGCPSHWFVCDDDMAAIRYFVIQGSDSIDHWKLNLNFDPVAFEDPALCVSVHRGVYEGAKALYERFLPLVREYIDSSPTGKVCFTGHSIGGSLATLLTIMFRHRGVLPEERLASCYTFGSPGVFSVRGPKWAQTEGAAKANSHCLLSGLAMRESDVINVFMARDIVPRAFTCDYSPIADILCTVAGDAIRDHPGMSMDGAGPGGRRSLYYFVGRSVILQPDDWHSFAAREPGHPLLPPGPGLYNIVDPAAELTTDDLVGSGATTSDLPDREVSSIPLLDSMVGLASELESPKQGVEAVLGKKISGVQDLEVVPRGKYYDVGEGTKGESVLYRTIDEHSVRGVGDTGRGFGQALVLATTPVNGRVAQQHTKHKEWQMQTVKGFENGQGWVLGSIKGDGHMEYTASEHRDRLPATTGPEHDRKLLLGSKTGRDYYYIDLDGSGCVDGSTGAVTLRVKHASLMTSEEKRGSSLVGMSHNQDATRVLDPKWVLATKPVEYAGVLDSKGVLVTKSQMEHAQTASSSSRRVESTQGGGTGSSTPRVLDAKGRPVVNFAEQEKALPPSDATYSRVFSLFGVPDQKKRSIIQSTVSSLVVGRVGAQDQKKTVPVGRTAERGQVAADVLKLDLTGAPDQKRTRSRGKMANHAQAVPDKVRHVASVQEAIYELMDNPHPLELLVDHGAYLSHGSVSRYHNPDNYTAALGRLAHLHKIRT